MSKKFWGNPPETGKYTPTITNTVNLDATNVYAAQYVRIGDMVNIFGRIDLDVTTADISTSFEMSIPIPSNLTGLQQVGGCMVSSHSDVLSASLEVTNDTIKIVGKPSTIANAGYSFNIWYWIN